MWTQTFQSPIIDLFLIWTNMYIYKNVTNCPSWMLLLIKQVLDFSKIVCKECTCIRPLPPFSTSRNCMPNLYSALFDATLGRCLIKLLLPDWADPRLGVVSLFLVAGAGVDGLVSTVVLSLVSPTAQIVGTMAVFTNRELSPRLLPDPVQVWLALFQLY